MTSNSQFPDRFFVCVDLGETCSGTGGGAVCGGVVPGDGAGLVRFFPARFFAGFAGLFGSVDDSCFPSTIDTTLVRLSCSASRTFFGVSGTVTGACSFASRFS